MTINFRSGDRPPVDLLAVAEGLYHEVAEELGRTLDAVQAGNLADLRSATQVVKELKDAFKIAMVARLFQWSA